jgi:hypothetical protein
MLETVFAFFCHVCSPVNGHRSQTFVTQVAEGGGGEHEQMCLQPNEWLLCTVETNLFFLVLR